MEYLSDVAFDIAPLDASRARALVDSLKIGRLLPGYRGGPPADIDALVETIVRFSWLVSDLAPGISELDINPVLATPSGAIAVDALIMPLRTTDIR